ncbi:hypothetical protein DFH06DRAFT_619008 [Mycena polygramma]|nr:hypothetical protein DFH06DRAFT_619008 [Mycena polygramma]
MNQQSGPSRRAAAYQTGSNSIYGEGAPHGDPFNVSAPNGGPVLHDPRSLGHGPPPTTCSTSLDARQAFSTPAAALSHGRAASHHVYDPSLVTTPTQNQYRIPSRPRAAVHPQFVILEEQTQMEQMLHMMQTLLHGQAELTQRISTVESAISQLQHAPVRGMAAERGRITRFKRVTSGHPRSVPAATSDESEPYASQPATTDADDDDAPSLDKVDLSATENRALQSFVTNTFRHVCRVPGHRWPDPTVVRRNDLTGEIYPTPVFDVTVSDPRNHPLFRLVAEIAFADLKNHDCWPQALRRPPQTPPPTWDLAYILGLVKESFRNLKKGWKQTQEVEAAIKADTDRCANRRLKRRKRKSQKLTKTLYPFAAKYGLDPGFVADLIHEQYLSDEVSGPEDDSAETKEAWKVRLASKAGLPLTPDFLRKIHILEILTPAWRSDSYSRLIHAMSDSNAAESSAIQDPTEEPAGEESRIVYHRVGVGRCSDRIPRYAPYDFGMSQQWWRQNGKRPANKKILRDWNKYPEPDNCGLVIERNADGDIVDARLSTV